jgi:hypothetical protein
MYDLLGLIFISIYCVFLLIHYTILYSIFLPTHVHGLRLQRGRRHRLQDHRFSPGAPHRHHYEQLCPLQRTVPDANRHHHHVFCRNLRRLCRLGHFRACADGRHTTGNSVDSRYFKAAVQNNSQGPALLVQSGTAAIQATAAWQGHRPFRSGQNAFCTGQSRRCSRARRTYYLADGKYPGGRRQPAHSLRGISRPVCQTDGPGWLYSFCLYSRLSRKRDRRPHHYYELHGLWLAGGNEQPVRPARPACTKWVDLADSCQHDALFTDALALRHNMLYHQEGNAEHKMDPHIRGRTDAYRNFHLHVLCKCCQAAGSWIK